MPQFSTLDLSHVPCLELLSEGFSNLPKLFEINISGCGVEQLLDLSHNNLTTFNITFGNCPSLEGLYLNNNNLTQSALFADLTSLRHLHLQSNGKLELTEHTFEALKHLETLDLSYNGLEILSPHLFGYKQVDTQGLYEYLPMAHMRWLNLNGNKLQQLDSRTFEKLAFLEELCLSNNVLRVLPKGLFVPIQNLKVLDMRHNQLTEISSDILKSLNNAKDLLINYNQLTTLPDLNGTLPQLQRMGIDGNPWERASFAPLEQWLIARKIQYLTDDYEFYSSD
ncbi:platelet glycoprotein V-like [Drosophila nasuta]|uniref:platelet glycoprotein V-like n=1 Tax=Drosophila nasuta TaxID=42062 RepID=UPI00295E6E71|nr:platelet glycoprotein V-like [Drosophila nasuta]